MTNFDDNSQTLTKEVKVKQISKKNIFIFIFTVL